MSEPELVGLDTSVVLRLLTGEPVEQAAVATRALNEISAEGKKAAVSDLVVSETYFALQFHFDVPKAKALATLRDFLSSEEIECIGVAAGILRLPGLAKSKPGFIDRLIHGEYDQQGSPMLSFEKAARKLPGSTVLKSRKKT